MSDRAVPQLPEATELADTDQLVIWQGDALRRVTLATLATFLPSGGSGGEPEPDPYTAAHWRIRRIASNHSSYVGLAELSFGATAAGGAAVASTEDSASGYDAAKAFDGDAATFWRTTSGAVTDAWIGYAYPEPITVEAVTIQAANTSTRSTYTPTSFAVERSDDGVAWAPVWTVEPTGSWSAGETRTFPKPA